MLSLKRVFIGDTRKECPTIVNHIIILGKHVYLQIKNARNNSNI